MVVESKYNQVRAAPCEGFLFDRVQLMEWTGKRWREKIYWDHAEWEERGTEAFEAILGVISEVASGKKVQ